MTRKDIHSALERAAADAVDRDFAAAAWGRGRTLRRRRQVGITTMGCLAVAAAAVGAIFLGGVGQDTAQPPLDPADTPVSTESPATDRAEQTVATTDDASTTDAVDASFRDDIVLVLGAPPDKTSADLTLATPQDVSGGEWDLLGPGPDWSVVGSADDTALRLGFDGTDWSVRGCGLDMRAAGGVTDGVVTLTGDWVEQATVGPGPGCEGTQWNVAQNWQRLFSEEPLIALDGATLVLVHAVTPAQGDEVSMVFDDVSAASALGDQTRDPVAADLDTFWQEVPAAQAEDQVPPVVDLAPDTVVLWSAGEGAIELYGPCAEQQAATWLLDTGEHVLLVGLRGSTEGGACEPGADREHDLGKALLSSTPTVQIADGQLVVQGSVPEGMLPGSAAATTQPRGSDCSASEDFWNARVQEGEASLSALALANSLAEMARVCETEALVSVAENYDTMLSLGVTTPQEAFALPEAQEQRYATLVSLLTEQEPVTYPARGDQPEFYEWGGGEDGTGWRVGISTDGAWLFFLAGG